MGEASRGRHGLQTPDVAICWKHIQSAPAAAHHIDQLLPIVLGRQLLRL